MDPNKRDYLFVDGGYLRGILQDFIRDIFCDDPPEINWQKFSSDSLALSSRSFPRTFYYDCPPPTVNREKTEERDAALAAFDSRMDAIGRTEGFHVFRGVIAGKKKQRQRQKRVDVQIAVDMLMHTLNRTMDSATLLAGDQDFIPVIEALVRAGMYVRVLYERSSASEDLLQSADEALEITPRKLHNWCSEEFKSRHDFPRKSELIASETTDRIESYRWDWRCTAVTTEGQNVRVIFMRDIEQWAVCYERSGDIEIVYKHKDPAVLKRFITNCTFREKARN